MKFKDLTLSTFSSAFHRIRNKKGLNKNKDKGVKYKNKGLYLT